MKNAKSLAAHRQLHHDATHLRQAGDLPAAAQKFRRLIALQPHNADYFTELAEVLLALQHYAESAQYAATALSFQPQHLNAGLCLGNSLLKQYNPAAAYPYLLRAVQGHPDSLPAQLGAARLFSMLQQWEQAIAHYQSAISILPSCEDAWIGLSEAQEGKGRADEAEATVRTALLTLNPTAPMMNRLGNLLASVNVNRVAEATAAYRHAAMLDRTFSPAYFNLGVRALACNDFVHAEEHTLRGMNLDPEHENGKANLAALRYRQGRLEEAAQLLQENLKTHPNDQHTRFLFSISQLLKGDYADGWVNWEARPVQKIFSQPRWDGRPAKGKTLLLHWEQGLGDTLQCIRYLKAVTRLCDRVVLWVQPSLADLLRCLPDVEVVTNPPEHFDLHLPLFSLPRVFGTRLDNASNDDPYLQTPAETSSHWQSWLAKTSSQTAARMRCGLVWSGNPSHANDWFRSMKCSKLDPLLAVEGIEWVNLQKDIGDEEDGEWIATNIDIDPMPAVNSFLDTAGIIDNLDLVITVDSSVAHLAGALGKPVWLFLSANPDWRWALDFPDSSPWYPSMRLFRQTRLGDWTEPVLAAKSALLNRLGHPISPVDTKLADQAVIMKPPKSDLCLTLPGKDSSSELVRQIAKIPFWHHRIALTDDVTTPGWAPLNAKAYDLPDDLTGKRVLDVGTRDGYWTFECLRRGAREVVAIDDFSDKGGVTEKIKYPEWESFDLCRQVLGYDESKCKRITMSVYDISEATLGRFDIVLLYGVIHQLRHPLLALDKIAAICDQELRIESPILDDFSAYRGGMGQGYSDGDTVLEFYPGSQHLRNPYTRWCPTLQALALMANSCGFTEVAGWKLSGRPPSAVHCRGFVTAGRTRTP